MGSTWLELLYLFETRTHERIPTALDVPVKTLGPLDRLPQIKTLIHNCGLLTRSVLKQTITNDSLETIKPCPHSALRLEKIGSSNALGGISMRPVVTKEEQEGISRSIIQILGHNTKQNMEDLCNGKLYKTYRPMALHKSPPWRIVPLAWSTEPEAKKHKDPGGTDFQVIPMAGRPSALPGRKGDKPTRSPKEQIKTQSFNRQLLGKQSPPPTTSASKSGVVIRASVSTAGMLSPTSLSRHLT